MTYIPRSGAEALMPEELSRDIIQSVPEQSAVMALANRAPDMSRAQRRIPVLSVLPTAYFLNPGPTERSDSSDISRKKLTRQMWENKYLDAEELAVIVAVPEAVMDDSDYDMWGEIRPKLLEAFGLAFDQAVFYGVNAPAAWPNDIVAAANAAGNVVTLGTGDDIYDDILSEDGVIAKVEEDGFMVSGHAAALTMRGKLRGLRDDNGQPIFKALYKEGAQGATRYELDGEPVYFPRNGSMIPGLAEMISGDWSQLIYAIRKDVTWKVLTEAVIQDPTDGTILYNLAQQDMVGLRAVMRLAWQVPNPINRIQETEADRYPFAVLGAEGS
jgi:HK97 family phage major capsid protein